MCLREFDIWCFIVGKTDVKTFWYFFVKSRSISVKWVGKIFRIHKKKLIDTTDKHCEKWVIRLFSLFSKNLKIVNLIGLKLRDERCI